MPPVGMQVYAADHPPVMARGYSFTNAELTAMLAEDVRAIIQDDAGVAEVQTLLAGVATTEFADTTVQQILSVTRQLEPWRVGEAIAEAYLVGFHFPTAENVRFSFGEVKTSNDQTCPPSLMYGRHGLKQQLENLRDSTARRGQESLCIQRIRLRCLSEVRASPSGS